MSVQDLNQPYKHPPHDYKVVFSDGGADYVIYIKAAGTYQVFRLIPQSRKSPGRGMRETPIKSVHVQTGRLMEI